MMWFFFLACLLARTIISDMIPIIERGVCCRIG